MNHVTHIHSCEATESSILNKKLDWMNETSFAGDTLILAGKNNLVFSVRAVNKRTSDHHSNFSPAPRAVLTFPGLHRGVCSVCVLLRLAPHHRCSDRGVSEASAGVLSDRDRALAGAEVRHMDAQHGAE